MFLTIIITIISAVLIIAGLVGSVVPVIPGPLLIVCGAFVYAWHTGFTAVSGTVIWVLIVLGVLGQVFDSIASLLGAQKFGASRWGVAGTVAGGIAGLFLGGLIGIIVGPFAGAVLGEILYGRSVNTSLKVGMGTLMGFLGGTIGRVIISITMTGIFIYQLIF